MPGLFVLIAAAVFARDAHQGLARARAEQVAPSARASQASPSAPAVAEPSFLQALPEVAPAAALVTALQEAGQREGVPILDLAMIERPADARQPGRTEVQVTLRGSYPQLRSLLSLMAADQTAPLLRRVALQRLDPGPDIEAVVDWWLPTRVRP